MLTELVENGGIGLKTEVFARINKEVVDLAFIDEYSVVFG